MPITPADKLISEGWKKKSTYDDPRLSEIVEMYADMGFEVHLEPFVAENEVGCTGCMQQHPERFKTIYIRKKTGNL